MPRQLIHFDEGEALTSAMVNNYIKEGLVPRADGKRYGPIHLGYLTAVSALKKILSVRDTGILLAAGQARNKTPEELYTYFCAALDRALADTADTIDENATREDLPRLALDLALRSYANQLACAQNGRDHQKHGVYGEQAFVPLHVLKVVQQVGIPSV